MDADTNDWVVEMLGAPVGAAGRMLGRVRDETTGRWLVPFPVEESPKEPTDSGRVFEEGISKELEEDAEFQRLLGIVQSTRGENAPEARLRKEPEAQVTAILDTGILFAHPLLETRRKGEVDFTGEGPEDRNGHGTISALLACRGFSPAQLRLLNVKVLGSDGRGKVDHVLAGLRWLVDYKEAHPEVPLFANLSLGFYSRRFWLFGECQGECKICRAAVEAAERGILVFAAAGNRPGETACPATVGLREPDSGVIAVAAPNYAGSGRGSTGTSGVVMFRPIDESR